MAPQSTIAAANTASRAAAAVVAPESCCADSAAVASAAACAGETASIREERHNKAFRLVFGSFKDGHPKGARAVAS